MRPCAISSMIRWGFASTPVCKGRKVPSLQLSGYRPAWSEGDRLTRGSVDDGGGMHAAMRPATASLTDHGDGLTPA